MTPSMLHKSLSAAPHSSSYLDASDTRSMSGEPPGGGAEPQTSSTTVVTTASGGQVVGSGGKLGYNNNQYVSGAHGTSVLSAEIQLGHIDDPSSGAKMSAAAIAQQQQLDNKSELSEHDGGGAGGTETTETKSMTSIKSGGSNADARYFIFMPSPKHKPLIHYSLFTYTHFACFIYQPRHRTGC